MIIRNLDASDDWTFGNGRQNYLRDGDAIALNVKTRIKSFLNDTFWNMNFGIDWYNLLGGRNPEAKRAIVQQCTAVVGASFGVVRINSVSVEFAPRTRGLTLSFNVDTTFTKNLTVGFPIS